MEREFIKTSPTGKTKIVLVTMPAEVWDKMNALHTHAQAKIPMITHDMIISTWLIEKLSTLPMPARAVEMEQDKLEDHNPS